MNELLQALTNADRICKQASAHYDKATRLEQEAVAFGGNVKKAKIKWIVIGLVILEACAMIGSLLASALGMLPLIGEVLQAVLFFATYPVAIFLSYKIASGKYKNEKKSVEAEMTRLAKQSEAEVHAAQEVFDEHAAEMDFLPVDYWYPMATEYLVGVVKSGRVQSLGDALDRFDAQLHRWKIEEANAQLVAQQEQQTAYLSSIKTSSKINAAANVTNTIFNIASRL